MAENSKIEWTDHTVNLWWGCSKVHTGCKHCYAEYLSDTRYQNNLWGEDAKRRRIKSAFKDLNRYQKEASAKNEYHKVFVGSMMDIFETDREVVDPTNEFTTIDQIRRELFRRIHNGYYDNLIFLFLTKRPENIAKYIPPVWSDFFRPRNVWFGVSISTPEIANKYRNILVEQLLIYNIFYSIEPQIKEIKELDLKHVQWIIQGGESGHNKRPFNIDWAYQMKQICSEQNVPYFFKQIDKAQPIPEYLLIREFPKFNV